MKKYLNQKGLIQWMALLILAVALPAVLYLTQKTQIFKPRATAGGTFQVALQNCQASGSGSCTVNVPQAGESQGIFVSGFASGGTNLNLTGIELYSIEVDDSGNPIGRIEDAHQVPNARGSCRNGGNCSVSATEYYTNANAGENWKYFIKVYYNPQTGTPTQPPAPTTPPGPSCPGTMACYQENECNQTIADSGCGGEHGQGSHCNLYNSGPYGDGCTAATTTPTTPTTPPGSNCPNATSCYRDNRCNQANADSACGAYYQDGSRCDVDDPGDRGNGCTAPEVEGVSTSRNVLQASAALYCSGLPQGNEPPCSGGDNGISQIVTITSSGVGGNPTPIPEGGGTGIVQAVTLVVSDRGRVNSRVGFSAIAWGDTGLRQLQVWVRKNTDPVNQGNPVGQSSSCVPSGSQDFLRCQIDSGTWTPTQVGTYVMYTKVLGEGGTVLCGENGCPAGNPSINQTDVYTSKQINVVTDRYSLGTPPVTRGHTSGGFNISSINCIEDPNGRFTSFYDCAKNSGVPIYCCGGPNQCQPIPNQYIAGGACYFFPDRDGLDTEWLSCGPRTCGGAGAGTGYSATQYQPPAGTSGYPIYSGVTAGCAPGQPGCVNTGAGTCPSRVTFTPNNAGVYSGGTGGSMATTCGYTYNTSASQTSWIKFRGVAWGAGVNTGPATCGDPNLICGDAKSWKVELDRQPLSSFGGSLVSSSAGCYNYNSQVCPVAVKEYGANETGNHTFKVTAYSKPDCAGSQIGTPFEQSIDIGPACTNTSVDITENTPLYPCTATNKCQTGISANQTSYLGGYVNQNACRQNCLFVPPPVTSPTPTPSNNVLPVTAPASVVVSVSRVNSPTDSPNECIGKLGGGSSRSFTLGTPQPVGGNSQYTIAGVSLIGAEFNVGDQPGYRVVCAQFKDSSNNNVGAAFSDVINYTAGGVTPPPTSSPTSSPAAGAPAITSIEVSPSCISGVMSEQQKGGSTIVWNRGSNSTTNRFLVQISQTGNFNSNFYQKEVTTTVPQNLPVTTNLTSFQSFSAPDQPVFGAPYMDFSPAANYSVKVLDSLSNLSSSPATFVTRGACTVSPTPSPSASPGRVACTGLTIDNNQSVSIPAGGGSKNIDVEFTPNDAAVRFSVTANPSSATVINPREVRFGTAPADRNWLVDIPDNTSTTENVYTINASITAAGTTLSCPRPLTVRVAAATSGSVCPATITSTQVKFRPSDNTGSWLGSRTINQGDSIKVAGFHNNETPDSSPNDITLSVSGPSGFSQNIVNGSGFTPPSDIPSGIFTFTATTTGKAGAACIGTGTLTVNPRPSPSPSGAACTVKTDFPDVNGDGKIDLLDLNIWRDERFGRAGTTSADVDCRNGVNDSDRNYIFDHFGETR